MLCVVLALAFAGASATRIVDRIQHQPGGPADHTHLPFSDIAYDAEDAAETFYSDGWRYHGKKILCPDCNKKRLKKKK